MRGLRVGYGKYAVAIAAIASTTALIIFGDPDKAEAWAVVAAKWGPGAVAALSAAVLWQQRTMAGHLKAQDLTADRRGEQLAEVTKKVDKVSEDVNGGSLAALQVKGEEAHARGVRETLEAFRPTIAGLVAEAVAAAVQVERQTAAREAAEAAALKAQP